MSSGPEEKTQEAPSNLKEAQKAPPNPKEKTREAPSDLEVETNDVAGLVVRSTDLKGSVVLARRKLTISGNFLPNDDIAHVESAGARRRGRGSTAMFPVDVQRSRGGRWREERVGLRRRELDDFAEEGEDTGADSDRHVTGTVNRQQAMNALDMEE